MSQSLKIPQATKKGYIEIEPGGAFDWSYPSSLTRRGRVQDGGGISPTITCNPENIYVYESMEKELQNKRYRIRKLTPRECFRLMDVCESDIDKIQTSGVSESQQYKMAGSSIVVACMVGIFKNLFTNEEEEMVGQLTLF
jgi:DNA (cytosine-5)-methyltransferase 1